MGLMSILSDVFFPQGRSWGQFSDLLGCAYNKIVDSFEFVNISTTNSCNRNCPYCPVSHIARTPARIDVELFEKIINEIAEIGLRGWIAPSRYGEPLLDERLEDFVQYTREKMPKVPIVIYTNGDYLTCDRFSELFECGATRFFVTRHLELRKEEDFAPGMDFWSDKEEISVRRLKGPLSNRGGVVQLAETRPMHRICCPEGLISLDIDYNGKVLLCCHQYRAEDGPVFGDLRENSLKEIWNSQKYQSVRRDLRRGNFNLEICNRCKLGALANYVGAHPY